MTFLIIKRNVIPDEQTFLKCKENKGDLKSHKTARSKCVICDNWKASDKN